MAGSLTRLRRRPSPRPPSAGFWSMGEVLGMRSSREFSLLSLQTVDLVLKLVNNFYKDFLLSYR